MKGFASSKAQLVLGVIAAVQVTALVTAAVSKTDNESGALVATGSAFSGGHQQLKPQTDVVELIGPASLLDAADAHVERAPTIPREDFAQVDLPANRSFSFGSRPGPIPAGASVGTQNAFMSVSPDVASPNTSAAFGVLLTGFIPGESIQFFISGSLAGTANADNYGRLGARISAPAGEGYMTFEGVSPTSGKRAGGVAEVLAGATTMPGLAIGPHAINPNGSSTIHMVGSRFLVGTPVTIARNGLSLGTVMSDSNGGFFITVTVPADGDTSAVYSANSNATGSLNGQSIEERADAGLTPQGDQNVSRAFVDRAVFSSTGATMALVGEGFQPAETVIISGCATGSAVADGNGAVSTFLSIGGGTGIAQCMFTGGTSGRVARATAQGHSNAVNVPSAINAPATLANGGSTFLFMYDRLAPSIPGAILIDGVSQGSASTNANGYGSVRLSAPSSAGIHSVVFAGPSGQVAIAPLYVLAAGLPPTPTATPTAAPTAAPTVAPASTPTPHHRPRVIPFR